jgi:hypothetical protein
MIKQVVIVNIVKKGKYTIKKRNNANLLQQPVQVDFISISMPVNVGLVLQVLFTMNQSCNAGPYVHHNSYLTILLDNAFGYLQHAAVINTMTLTLKNV